MNAPNMRVLIFGISGMLGHKLYQRLGGRFDVLGTLRTGFQSVARFGVFDPDTVIENVDVFDLDSVRRAIEQARPDCVINAVGVIKQLPSAKDVIKTLTINSIFPHRLSELSREFGFRLITISTDCVFDGAKGNYSESDPPDARDLYGMSKLLGETNADNALTIRTSIIGRELDTSHSIVEWFLSNRGGCVNGYTTAIYTGFPTVVMADILADLVARHPDMHGVWHVASDPITKFDLLALVNKYYDAKVRIEPSNEVALDRSLDPSRFRAATGFSPPSWEEMIALMAADSTPYDHWH
jgi:dTDP-4-dehydrorhamnose reductase